MDTSSKIFSIESLYLNVRYSAILYRKPINCFNLENCKADENCFSAHILTYICGYEYC